MTDLGRDARALVARVKKQDGPTAADRARLRRKLEPAWAAQREAIAEVPEVAPRVAHGQLSWVAGLLLMSFGFVAPEAPRVDVKVDAQAMPPVASHSGTPPAAVSGEPERPSATEPAPQPAAPAELARTEVAPRPGRVAERRARLRPSRPAAEALAAKQLVSEGAKAEHEHEFEPAPPPVAAQRVVEPARPSVADTRETEATRGSEVAPNVRSRGFAAQPIDDELTWLSAAQEALQNNKPSAALRLVQEHAFRFPQGALASERVAVQALALCALSRKTAARDVLSDLEQRAPNSPLLARVRRNCGF